MSKKISDANKKGRYNILSKDPEARPAGQEEVDNVEGRVLYNQ